MTFVSSSPPCIDYFLELPDDGVPEAGRRYLTLSYLSPSEARRLSLDSTLRLHFTDKHASLPGFFGFWVFFFPAIKKNKGGVGGHHLI